MTQRRFLPPEWRRHDAVWTGWPSAADLWEADLEPARREMAAFVRAVADGEIVRLVYRGATAGESARTALDDLVDAGAVDLVEAPIGDIWLRDTGPVFIIEDGSLAAAQFAFNGWGGRFVLPSDEEISAIVSDRLGARSFDSAMVLEGGAIDVDGEGTLLTTRQCLLNVNRNPGLSEADAEAELRRMLGVEKVIWLDDGLLNDHTDGHIDNLARFVAPGRVVCMRPNGDDDPNAAVYAAARRALEQATDATGRKLDVVEIPSPGRVDDNDGEPAPASHVNFYIANEAVVMPAYAETEAQTEARDEAAAILSDLFPDRKVAALSARHVLTGGGAFHCATQQQPVVAISDLG